MGWLGWLGWLGLGVGRLKTVPEEGWARRSERWPGWPSSWSEWSAAAQAGLG